ncbi:hypothetical protein ACSV5M_17515 [Cellvibrio sp. ARAG 10.3]|uniref:hypothetical protein n=1 Tax=Cellvibrio sp. ARAG 10.3 TaxID=3451358 RepID=UPI003F479C67
MQIGDLSEEEIALIDTHRKAEAARKAATDFHRKALFVAHDFEEWSVRSDERLTISTFINTFGYQDKDGWEMYETVKRINEAAWPLRCTVNSIEQAPKQETFPTKEDASNLNLADRFVKVIALLDGLSREEISCLLANIEDCWCSYRSHERAATIQAM